MGLVLLGKEERSKMRQKCGEHLWGRTPLENFARYRILSAEESLTGRIAELRLTIPIDSAQRPLNRGIPQLRNLSIEEFLGSGVPEHSRVVSIKGGSWPLQNYQKLDCRLHRGQVGPLQQEALKRDILKGDI